MSTHPPADNAMQGDPVYDYAVIIGRFQPVHKGHVALLQAGLQHARRLIVVAGSMQQPRSFKNPFTVAEREQMLRAALPAHEQVRVQVVGVSDAPYDDAAWQQAVQSTVHTAMAAHGGDPAAARIALLGHMKDDSSYYLRIFPRWQWLPFNNVEGIDATTIRNSYFGEGDKVGKTRESPAVWQQANILPATSVGFLYAFRQTPAWQRLHEEYVFLRTFRQQHGYVGGGQPLLCLVQVVMLWRRQVLLVQRQQPPGQGNWALPETLVQAGERLIDAACRALHAVGIEQPGSTIRPRISATAVFDVPGRNQLGHAISHAFCVRWPDDAPIPQPADTQKNDAEAHRVRWQPVAQWQDMQPFLHEDHYFIARHFLDPLAASSAATTPTPNETTTA